MGNNNKTMKIVRLLIIFGLFIFGIVLDISATKPLKQIKINLKTASVASLSEARSIVEKSLKDSLLNGKYELYDLAIQVENKLYNVQNVKLFLKQKYDTIALYKTGYNIVDYARLADSIDMLPDKKGRIKAKYKKENTEQMTRFYPNLYNAGLFYAKKGNYGEVKKYMSKYIDMKDSPILSSSVINNPKIYRAAFWHMMSCFEQKRYKDVFMYSDLAEKDTTNYEIVLRSEVIASDSLADTIRYVDKLWQGIKTASRDRFFFTRLTDYYNLKGDYEKSYLLTDSLMKTDTSEVLYKFAHGVVSFNIAKYDECISVLKSIINADSINSDTYYYIALCYYNKAVDEGQRLNSELSQKEYRKIKKVVTDYYSQSMPYMEKYRSLFPDRKDRWGLPLYKIYLSLNMATKFAEIEKILKK